MSILPSKYDGLNNSAAIRYFDETLVYASKRPQTSFANHKASYANAITGSEIIDERVLSFKPMQCKAFKDNDASKTS